MSKNSFKELYIAIMLLTTVRSLYIYEIKNQLKKIMLDYSNYSNYDSF